MFARNNFGYSPNHSKFIVKKQPNNPELSNVRAAMSACPVGAIRAENSAQRNHIGKEKLSEEETELAKSLILNPKLNSLALPFPQTVPGFTSIYHLGHHNHRSFGAVPYLIQSEVNVMVDSPKYSAASVKAISSLCDGPDYLFLTHVDDIADHEKWKDHYPNLKRIIHEEELENNWIGDEELKNVEIILRGSLDEEDKVMAWDLDGNAIPIDLNEPNIENEFIILHTPGHSLGSISLLHKSTPDNRNALFTGDTYAYSLRLKSMTGFPYYGRDLNLQSQTLRKLLRLPWDFIAPGHGSYKDYSGEEKRGEDVDQAIEYMLSIKR